MYITAPLTLLELPGIIIHAQPPVADEKCRGLHIASSVPQSVARRFCLSVQVRAVMADFKQGGFVPNGACESQAAIRQDFACPLTCDTAERLLSWRACNLLAALR